MNNTYNMDHMNTSERSQLFIERLVDGTIPKMVLKNHGEDFEEGAEDISCVRFSRFIGSCSYLLMKNRIDKEARSYYGI